MTAAMQAQGSRDRQYLLDSNMREIQGALRQPGVPHPAVVFVVDTRDSVGRRLMEAMAGKAEVADWHAKATVGGLIPTFIATSSAPAAASLVARVQPNVGNVLRSTDLAPACAWVVCIAGEGASLVVINVEQPALRGNQQGVASPTAPEPPGAVRAWLAETGATFWPETYEHTQDDDEAQQLLIASVAKKAEQDPDLAESLTDPGEAVAVAEEFARNLATARWFDQGLPVVQMGHRYAAALLATQVSTELAAELRAPWKAFVIDVPDGLLKCETNAGVLDFRTILVHEEWHSGTPTYSCWALHGQRGVPIVIVLDNSIETLLEPDTTGSTNDEWHEWHDESSKDALNRVRFLMTRLVLNVIAAIAGEPSTLGSARTTSGKTHRGGKKEPSYRIFQLGKALEVDCRPAIARYLAGSTTRAGGGVPNVVSLVRGHRKLQAYGRDHGLRKSIWVQPYWRGPEGAAIVVRPHVLGRGRA